MDDHAALKDIRKGGQKGYTALHQRYAITLHGYVISKYDIPIDDVEDILQRIFLKFFNTIDTFKQDCSVSTWLHGIAKSIAIDYWRVQANKPHTVSIDTDDGETGDNTVGTLLDEMSEDWSQKAQNDLDIQMCIERALAQLQRDGSKTSLLKCLNTLTFFAQGSSIQEIAKEFGKNPDTTRRYLLDCRTRLRQYQPIQRCREWLNGN
ncbi:MAG: hypothetical protein DRR19_27590 [Candidatus Parabeggiatoa sp. nov. 1]|nr:MAG: hypothetical protein DRR19_27590 [Gammaproteobacteria bacterium]